MLLEEADNFLEWSTIPNFIPFFIYLTELES